jgi:hypothetical protein
MDITVEFTNDGVVLRPESERAKKIFSGEIIYRGDPIEIIKLLPQSLLLTHFVPTPKILN